MAKRKGEITWDEMLVDLKPGDFVFCTRLRGDEVRLVTMLVARIEDGKIFAYDPHWGSPEKAKDVSWRVEEFQCRG